MPLRHLQGYESHMRDRWLLLYLRGEGQGWQDNLQFPVSLRNPVPSTPSLKWHPPLHTVHNNYNNKPKKNQLCNSVLPSCLHMSQSFPPGRFIWCNEGLHGGPTARPAATRGGHACCKDRDFCNRDLKPVIKYYRSAIAAAPAGPGGLQTPTLVYEGAPMHAPPARPLPTTPCSSPLTPFPSHWVRALFQVCSFFFELVSQHFARGWVRLESEHNLS